MTKIFPPAASAAVKNVQKSSVASVVRAALIVAAIVAIVLALSPVPGIAPDVASLVGP